jgi:hypothetical protein
LLKRKLPQDLRQDTSMLWPSSGAFTFSSIPSRCSVREKGGPSFLSVIIGILEKLWYVFDIFGFSNYR